MPDFTNWIFGMNGVQNTHVPLLQCQFDSRDFSLRPHLLFVSLHNDHCYHTQQT